MKNREGDSSNPVFSTKNGGLAHLARALRWQRRGDRFESDILHNLKIKTNTQTDDMLFGYFYLQQLCFILIFFIQQLSTNITLDLAKILNNVYKIT